MKLLSIASISLLLAFACLRTSAQKPTDKGAMALEDSISKELSYIPIIKGYNQVNVPDSVLIERLSKSNIKLIGSKPRRYEIPNIVSQENRELPDSVKIHSFFPGWTFNIYNGRKGTVKQHGLKRTLPVSTSIEMLKLINKIIFVNKGQIIAARWRFNGAIYQDPETSITIDLYSHGKKTSYTFNYIDRIYENCIVTYSQPFIDLWNLLDYQVEYLRNIKKEEMRKNAIEHQRQRRKRQQERQRQQAEQAEQAQQAEQAVPTQ